VPAERRRRRPPAGNPRMIPKKRTGLALHLLCDPPCAWEGRRGERIRVWCYMLCFSADVSNARARDVRVAHLKLLIAKMKRDRFGASAERGRKLLDQLEMQLEKLETAAAEGLEAAPQAMPNRTTVRLFTRAKPVRAPLPAHLPRQRVVLRPRLVVRAAVASSSSWGRPSPRRWRPFRAATSSPAAPARRSRSHQHRSIRQANVACIMLHLPMHALNGARPNTEQPRRLKYARASAQMLADGCFLNQPGWLGDQSVSRCGCRVPWRGLCRR
jgi:hypothetical protein